MANVKLRCLNCGSTDLRVRTSKPVTLKTVETDCQCNNCSSKQKVLSEVVCLRTAVFTPQPEALKANVPFKQVNKDQLDFPLDEDLEEKADE